MKRINKRGPNIEPCGTPDLTARISDNVPLTVTRCFLPYKYSFINFSIRPSMLYSFLSFRRIMS